MLISNQRLSTKRIGSSRAIFGAPIHFAAGHLRSPARKRRAGASPGAAAADHPAAQFITVSTYSSGLASASQRLCRQASAKPM
jgi:hypothetical protein